VDLYIFSARCYIAQTAVVKVCAGNPKTVGTNKFVRPKSHTGSKFSKISLGLLCTRRTIVVYLYCHFCLRSQMAPQQTAKFWTASFRHFRSTLRNDCVVNYGSIWTIFPPSVRGLDVLYNKRFIFPSVGGTTDSQICVRNFPRRKKIGRRVVPNPSYGYYWDSY